MNLRHMCGRIVCAAVIVAAQVAVAALDWQGGPWGVVIDSNGSPGSAACPIDYPGGTKTGNALAVYYQFAPTDLPQLWVFLTDGFWRQTSAESELLTSYRLFRYFSSGDQDCDRLVAAGFRVLGTNAAGELQIETVYSNNATAGDRFRVTGTIVLEKPDALQSAMRAEVVVSNASGRAVTPAWQPHRLFAQQWELFGISSMHVATNLTGGLPSWYDTLDPAHRYVGITNDAGYLNDGYSLNGGKHVSTHDVQYVVTSNVTVGLDRDTNVCPILFVPGYTWYSQLVMRAQDSPVVLMQHAYRSARNHRAQLVSCSGLTSAATNLRWSVTYDRFDPHMVDGDSVQVSLGMDDFLNEWLADAVQVVGLRLSTGDARPTITSLSAAPADSVTIGWTTEPGERYALQYVSALGGAWSNVIASAAGPVLGPLSVPPGFLRIVETNAP